MTRSLLEVLEVLALRDAGLGARRISAATGVPVKTVQGWIADPDRALDRPKYAGLGDFAECHGRCEVWVDVDPTTYSYLLGMYLGDGHIVRMPRCYRLSIYCDPKYPTLIEEISAAVEVILSCKVGSAWNAGAIAVTGHSQHVPCYFPQHGPGLKHNRPIVLAPWQQDIVEAEPHRFIRGLLHSDGWRGNNVAIRHGKDGIEYRRYTRYQFSNRSEDIRKLFCWALDLLDVHWTQSNQWTISVARRKDVHYLDTFVGPKR